MAKISFESFWELLDKKQSETILLCRKRVKKHSNKIERIVDLMEECGFECVVELGKDFLYFKTYTNPLFETFDEKFKWNWQIFKISERFANSFLLVAESSADHFAGWLIELKEGKK